MFPSFLTSRVIVVFAGVVVAAGAIQAATAIRITNDPAASTEPFVCTQWNGNGDVSIVWIDTRGGVPAVYFTKTNQTGTKLLGDIQVSGGASAASLASCAVDSAGNTSVVWKESSALMYAKLSSLGAISVAPFVRVAGAIDMPRIDVEPGGSTHFVWVKSTGTRQVKYMKAGVNGQNVGCTELILETATTSNVSEYPFVLAPGWGNTYSFVSWHAQDPTHSYMDAHVVFPDCNHLISNGPFQQTNDIVVGRSAMQDNQAGESTFLAFQGVGTDSKEHVFWLRGAGNYFAVDTDGGPATLPDVAALNDQNQMVVWEGDRYPAPHVFSQMINGTTGLPVGNNCLVSDGVSAASKPTVARTGASTFAIVWQDDRDGSPEIYLKIRGVTCPEDPILPSCLDTDGNGNADNDGDGLCDNWEVSGIDVNNDGTIDLNLQTYDINGDTLVTPSERASLNVKDVYVEVDWMDQHGPCLPPLFCPSMWMVANSFGNAGIRLHVLVDEMAVAHADRMAYPPETLASGGSEPDFDAVKAGHFGTASERGAANSVNILKAKKAVFHYALFVHGLLPPPDCPTCDYGGVGESPGNDFIIALHDYDHAGLIQSEHYWDKKAGLFMHELGHNLGLAHGGQDNTNCKPNYLSVMNYIYQWTDNFVSRRPLDYSRRDFPLLQESALSEGAGISGRSGDRIAWGPPFCSVTTSLLCSEDADCPGGEACGQRRTDDASGAVDWNGNGTVDSGTVAVDINHIATGAGDDCPASPGQTLKSWEDWSALRFAFQGAPDYLDGRHASNVHAREADADELAAAGIDSDGDTITDINDKCPTVSDPAQADADGDGSGDLCDCSPANAAIYPGAFEANDGLDNQCAGDPGFGLVDEIDRAGFLFDKTEYQWDPQPGATAYEVARSPTPQFSGSCSVTVRTTTFWVDPAVPSVGQVYYYLVRASAPNVGSWGRNSSGAGRSVSCP